VRTGEQHSIEVQPSYGISDSDIERMLEESIEYAEQDFAVRQAIEARTEAGTILAATTKALANPQSASLTPEERGKIDAAVTALHESTSGMDYRLMRKKIDELNEATQHLAEVMMNSAVNSVLQGKKLDDF
jgi:molecular chaperone DnaK (HSP70)